MSSQLVLVSGATGFLGTEVALAFLAAGFKVRGTARSQEKIDAWNKLHPHPSMQWFIVKDVAQAGAFDSAIVGVNLVAHTASPFTYAITDNEKDLLIPAVHGTMEMMRSAAKTPSVSRVVITSSFASILDLQLGAAVGTTYTDTDWNPATWQQGIDESAGFAYCASKKLAERAAWDFVGEHKPHFSLTTLCPPIIFGPPNQVISSVKEFNTSTEAIWGLVDAAEVPPTAFPVFIDVRDIALLHVKAVTLDVAKNQRYLTIAGHFDNTQIIDLINKNFPTQSKRMPKITSVLSDPSGHFKSDSSKVEKQLDIKWITFEKSVIDTAAKLFEIEQQLSQ